LELHEKYGSFLTRGVNNVVDLGAAPGGWSQVVAGKMGWTEELDMSGVDPSRRGTRGKGERLGSRLGGGGVKRAGSWSKPEADENKHSPYESFYEPKNEKPLVGRGTVVAVDLHPISPIPGVHTLQTDFLSPEAGDLIHAMLMSPTNPEGKADLILSDMAGNFTGNKVRDTESSLDICLAVFAFVKKNLRTTKETGNTYSGSLLCVYPSSPYPVS
jgi:23S rRNA (uridine2552-2'-O)-methyltransferase